MLTSYPRLNRVVRRADLHQFVGVKKTLIHKLIARGDFPRPIRVGARAVAWLEDDLVEWQQQRRRQSEQDRLQEAAKPKRGQQECLRRNVGGA